MGVADYGTGTDPLSNPNMGAWAGSVAAALDSSDVTVDARIAAHNADTTGVHGFTDTAALQTTITGKVDKSTYDANTILKADADNTPIALPVAEQRMVGRLTAGSISALTAAQVRSFVGTEATHPSTDDAKVRVYDDVSAAPRTIHYDTGRRALTLSNSWTATTAVLRRVGPGVEFVLVGLNGASATGGTVVTLDAAFRPSYPLEFAVGTTAGAFPTLVVSVATTGEVSVGGAYTGVTAGSLIIRFNTDAAAPVTLPGSMVSIAPVD